MESRLLGYGIASVLFSGLRTFNEVRHTTIGLVYAPGLFFAYAFGLIAIWALAIALAPKGRRWAALPVGGVLIFALLTVVGFVADFGVILSEPETATLILIGAAFVAVVLTIFTAIVVGLTAAVRKMRARTSGSPR